MDGALLEVSIGTVSAGCFLLAYILRTKKKLRGRILRDYTSLPGK